MSGTPHARRRCRAAALWLAAVTVGVAAVASATEVVVPLQPNQKQTVTLEAALDDTNFRAPLSYRMPDPPQHRFVRRVTLRNTGTTPMNGRLIVNGQDWSSPEALRESLRLPAAPGAATREFFQFWWNHRAHASSGLKAAEDPIALLNFWGYTLCGEDAVAAPHFLAGIGIPARRTRLVGHVASEYFYDAGWHFFDGDQNACYLRLDNSTVASADEILADPFLVLRTKVFGRHAPLTLPASAYNASLFDRSPAKEARPFKPKPPAITLRDENLLPGEMLIFHYDQAPAVPLGSSNLDEWNGMRAATLGLVEHRLNTASRRDPSGIVHVNSPSPITRIVNDTTGATFQPARGELVFEGAVLASSAEDAIGVYRQRALVAFPPFRKGANELSLRANAGAAAAELTIDYEPHRELTAPRASLRRGLDAVHGAPGFDVESEAGIDRLWWQIAASEDFRTIVPNFDAVVTPSTRIEVDALSATLLSAGSTHFARVRARRNGVWGEWSASLPFEVHKPLRPQEISTSTTGGRLQLSWRSAGEGADYLVFGSNRLDFVPDLYEPQEIVEMRSLTVLSQRPNQNLVSITPHRAIELTPAFRFYRIVARSGGMLSVPSELIRTPTDLTGALSPATALQMHWSRVPTPSAKNGYVDSYLATEAPLPVTAARDPRPLPP